MPATKYYPSLSTVFNFDFLPEPFGFIRDAGNSVLDKILLKRKDISVSSNGDTYSMLITLVVYNKLRFEIPGTGLALIMNPPQYEIQPGVSEFTITLEVKYPLLRYLGKKKIANLLLDPAEIFELVLSLLGVNVEDLFFRAVQLHTYDGLPQQLINKINQHYNLSPAIPPITATELNINDILTIIGQIESNTQLSSQNVTVYDVLFDLFINDSSLGEGITDNLDRLFFPWTGGSATDIIKKMLIPQIMGSLHLGLALEIPRSVLLPLDNTTLEPLPVPDPNNPPKTLLLFAQGDFIFSTQEGFGFDSEIALTLVPLYSGIGKTGLIVGFTRAKLDLSRTKNIPEADADGRPLDFIGVYVQEMNIILPKKWFKEENGQTLKISGRNTLIGTGGISGTLAIETINNTPPLDDDYFWFKLGKDAAKAWRLGFNKFDITFKQNAVTSSNIIAALEIPKFKEGDSTDTPLRVNLVGHLAEDGDFSLTASIPGGVQANLFNFVNFNFLTFELGREDDNFYVGTSCEITFKNEVMRRIFKDQTIVLPKLRIYSNGRIEIVGGNAFIPVNISLSLGPVEVAVTGIHFGSHQQEHGGQMRKYNYWGFDGAISIDPLGIDARGEGIKYYYTCDNDEHGGSGDSFLRIQTIEVDLVIPGTASAATALAIIHGMVSIPEPGESPEYMGEVSLKLPKAKIAGGAAMRLQPKSPAFIVDAFIDLPAPIPIGPVGIYGFRGLIGFRYVAEKEAVGLVSGVDSWYDYYVHPPKGIHISKFSGPERTKDYSFPFSIGVGAVLGTSFDSGTIISIRAMLLLSLPTLFMIEGRASILSARLGLTDDKEPPFFAFIAWGDHSLELGIGADFKLPQNNGWIIDLHAEIQAGFFFGNAKNWYVNFGTKQDPIRARVLTIITAQSYLMFSSQGIEAGARVDFELKKSFGPAKVHIHAYVEVGGHISFERPQIGGYLAMGGMIDIEIWIVGISIGLDALLSVEAAKPFLLYAELRIRVCVRIIVKVCKSFTIKIKWEKDGSVERRPVAPLSYDPNDFESSGRNRTEELVKGVHMLTNESFDINFLQVKKNGAPPTFNAGQINKIVPLDTFIDIKTEKGLVPNALDLKIGGHTGGAENFTDLVPPVKIIRGGREVRQVKHKYSAEEIEIRAWTGTQWVDYHPYQAIVPAPQNVTHLRVGWWQRSGNQYDTIRLLGNTPFSYTQAGEPGWFIPEEYGITPSSLFCSVKEKKFTCSNVLNKPLGTIYYPPQQYNAHLINGAYYTLEGGLVPYDPTASGVAGLNGDYMKVSFEPNPFGFSKSLSFNNYNSMVITLPEAAVSVKLKFTTNALGANIKYYKSIIDDTTSQPQYVLVSDQYKTAAQLAGEILYDDEGKPVTKIIITPKTPNTNAINTILEEIESLFADTYENVQGNVPVTVPSNEARYRELLLQLEQLRNEGCTSSPRNYFSNYYAPPASTSVRSLHYWEIGRMGDNYLLAAEMGSINDDFGSNSTIIILVNGAGDIIREKYFDGALTEALVVGNEIYVTISKRYAINLYAEIPMIVKLDAGLNTIIAKSYQPVLTGCANHLLSHNDDFLIWFGGREIDRPPYDVSGLWPNGTRVTLINKTTLNTVGPIFIPGIIVSKVCAINTSSYVILGKQMTIGAESQLVTVTVNSNFSMTLSNMYANANFNVEDIFVTGNGQLMMTGRHETGRSCVGFIKGPDVFLFSSGSFSDLPLLFTTEQTQDGFIYVYNWDTVFTLSVNDQPGAYAVTVEAANKLQQTSVMSGPPIRIQALRNNKTSRELFLNAGLDGYYKGIIFAVLGEDFSYCNWSPISFLPIQYNYTTKFIVINLTTIFPIIYGSPVTINGGNTTEVIKSFAVCGMVQQPGTSVRCSTSLQQVCWFTVTQQDYYNTIPGQAAVQQDQQAMVEALQKTAQPIWRPNTKYYVRFRLKDEVDGGSSAAGIYDYYYGFQTAGPVGHYHLHPAAGYIPSGTANPDQYPLSSLRQYIDYERSYPNADGSLLQAKPLFYGHQQCKIDVYFAQPLAYHMLGKWKAYNGLPEINGEMHIAIKDPATDTVIPYPLPANWTDETVPLPDGSNTWLNDNDPRIPLGIRVLNNFVNYINTHPGTIQCQLTIGSPLAPNSHMYSVTLTNLRPRKLYTAILYNAFDRDSNNTLISQAVHEYVFQTSRYKDFEEQVRSYLLKDDDNNEKQAVFHIDLNPTAAEINTAYNIISQATPDTASQALATRYQHLFDRVTEGVLGIKPLDAPVTTEFNVLRHTTSGDILAIWIRNPEPFNIPKIPLAQMSDTLIVLDQSGNHDQAYSVLHSKDYSQALIMHSSKKITAPALNLRFRYKTWNGSAYAVQSTIDAQQILINI